MAKKRKTKTTSRKRTSTRRSSAKGNSFWSSLKRMFLWACFLLIALIGLLFLFDCAQQYPRRPGTTYPPERIDMPGTVPDTKEKPAATGTFAMPELGELSRLMAERTEQVIFHEGYTVSYNSDYCIANWVAYELTREEAESKKEERTNKFVPDPLVIGATAVNEDYTRTGFDRGHLAPAGDMKWSAKAMRESFYFSNICPQDPGLNRGAWKKLEDQVRVWAKEHGAVLVVTGPVIKEDMRRLGKNRVGVPEQFYKVVCTMDGEKPVGIGFLFDNTNYKNYSIKTLAIPIDSVEKVTGIDFYYQLPQPWQEEMESRVDWDCWRF